MSKSLLRNDGSALMGTRVLHIGKFFPPHHGGMEIFLADLVHAQQAQGLEVAVLVHGDPLPDDPPWLVRVPVQIQLIYAPIALGFRSALAQVLERFYPDVLHLHMPNTSVFWALTSGHARKLPWVVHWHSDVVVSQISKALAVAYRCYRPLEQAVLDRAERIIVTSPPYLAASEPLNRWYDKCAVVPLGLDADKMPASAAASTLSALPWAPGHFRLLSIGRLTYYKGFETLVRVVASLPGTQLLIIGDGELRPALEALILQSTPKGARPQVELLGAVDDAAKHALLQSCDVFCLASRERTEAFGMVLLEAMAHAKPCIVSDLQGSGMPWLIEQADAGLRVGVHDVDAWRVAVDQLRTSASLRSQFGAKGLNALHAHFSIRQTEQAIQAHYAGIVSVRESEKPEKGVLIVIPAKDEAATIGLLLDKLKAAGWLDVLVVDDHSRDATGAIARECGAKLARPALPLGAWGAMQLGIRYALANGYNAVVTMDADGQHEVSELPLLASAVVGADVVIGAFPERASSARRVAWRWFKRISGFELSDLTSGFRYYKLKAMKVLASDEATLLDYQDIGVLLLLRNSGCHIVEVPVQMNSREVGKSKIFSSWVVVTRYMVLTTLLCLSRWSI